MKSTTAYQASTVVFITVERMIRINRRCLRNGGIVDHQLSTIDHQPSTIRYQLWLV
jgi:hypothetical protein